MRGLHRTRGRSRGKPLRLRAMAEAAGSLHDSSGHLPRSSRGTYLSRTTGRPLRVDRGYSSGDACELRAYHPLGVAVGTVHGTPATGRRSGFDAFSDSDYMSLSMSSPGDGLSFLAQYESAGSFSNHQVYMSETGSDPIWTCIQYQFPTFSGHFRAGVIDSGWHLEPTIPTGANAGDDGFVASSMSAGATEGTVWYFETDGTLNISDTDTAAGRSVGNDTVYVGRGRNPGNPADSVHALVILGWDGFDIPEATHQSYVDARAAGDSIDTIARDLGPASLMTDGLICGAYDPAAPSDLFAASGGGFGVVIRMAP